MDFLSSLKQVFQRGKEAFVEGVTQIRETVRDIGNKVEEWRERYRRKKEERKIVEEERKKKEVFVPEPRDKEIIDQISDLIRETFPGGIGATLSNMSAEQRQGVYEDLARQAAAINGLSDPPTIEFDICASYGYYNLRENKLCINSAMIDYGNAALLAEQVYTIFHEMTHARQRAAIVDYEEGVPSAYGYSDEKIYEYVNNYQNYTSPRVSYSRYCRQPVERDAFGIENAIKEETIDYL